MRDEGLSRVDWAFDCFLPEMDFDEDSFVTLSVKDATHREDRKAQTFSFGTGDVRLRVYDKVAEIVQKSAKTWFFQLWGVLGECLADRVAGTKGDPSPIRGADQLRQMREWCKTQGIAVAMEYIEPGASATDDRRPVFQQMVSDATLEHAPYEAIIVHSRSRFFRDLFQFMSYERTLKRAGVRVISITQQTSDDPAGEMARTMFSLFDEYQSKENGKHTLRAMKENARQGYFNGSKAPFGYKAVETEAVGRKGKKKRLEVDPGEVAIVRRIFQMYQDGLKGIPVGEKGIAARLNAQGTTLRGQKWTRGKVHTVLANRTYCGDYVFNRKHNKSGDVKPETEWVRVAVEPIIDAETFGRVHATRAARAPAKVPPRVLNSPTLLTGLLKCGHCGAGMTLATGKGGRYRYYKCHSRIAKGNKLCPSGNIPMQRLDELVLKALSEKVFTPERLRSMIAGVRKRMQGTHSEHDAKLKVLTKELNELKGRSDRLFEAVESGHLPLDTALQQRAHKLQARRQELLLEIAGLKRQTETPAAALKDSQVEAFERALKSRLNGNRPFAKQYLRLLVSQIRLADRTVEMRGSYEALARAVAGKPGVTAGVPSFASSWLPMRSSTLIDVAALVREALGRAKPDGTPQKLLDISLIRSLGWKPRIALAQGLAGAYGTFKTGR